MPDVKKVEISFDYYANVRFAWQLFFNRFSIEDAPVGKLVCFASVYEGKAPEILPVVIGKDALVQLRSSVETYLPQLAGAPDAPSDTEKLPNETKRMSSMFVNHIRLARSGNTAELMFYTVPLSFIADEIRGTRKAKSQMSAIPVAILHSSLSVHYRFLNRLLNDVPTEKQWEDEITEEVES
jgi:hypothetical protein